LHIYRLLCNIKPTSMVSELNLTSRNAADFPVTAPAAYPVFFRTYSRFVSGSRENWQQVCTRTLRGLVKLGNLEAEEAAVIDRMQRQVKALPSGRWLWVGGSEWLERPENFSGAYNCTSTNVIDWRAFGLMMDLAMMGCGTGAILEPELIDQLPVVRNLLEIGVVSAIGSTPPEQRRHLTDVEVVGNHVTIHVGDSRQGWVKSYQTVLELCSDERFSGTVKIDVNLADVRPAGELLKGFGGMANPVKLPELYARCVQILNKAHGRKLNSVECCLLIDEAAVTIVAGNIRRSAGIRQFNSADTLGANAKDNLWQQGEDGSWKIDPERDSLRMANHTRVFHRKPSLEECVDAVRKQYYSGEGAIQWAGEAVARSNADVISPEQKRDFLAAYSNGTGLEWLNENVPSLKPGEAEKKLWRYGLNPCGEIIGADFHCVSGSTFLITKDGLHQIKDVVGQEVEIWNGESWSQVTPMVTGRDRKLYRVQFGDGTFLDVTDKHRFFVADRFNHYSYKELTTAELQDALVNHPYKLHTETFTISYEGGEHIDPTWAYTLGQLVGDGSICKSNGKPQLQLRLYGEKSYKQLAIAGKTSGTERYYSENKDLPCLLYTGFHQNFDAEAVRLLKYSADAFDAIASWDRDSILHFVAGLADADGSAVSSGGIRLYISDYDRAYRIYLLLLKCGVRSSVNLVQKAGTMTNLGERKKDLWYLQITDCTAIPCQRLDTRLGHEPLAKGKWQMVRTITELTGLHDTYCFNEPIHHKGVFGGTLTGQCNLAEVHLNQISPDNLQEQEDAFRASALSVAVLLNHQFQEPRYQSSRLQDPIVGVSFTGLFDFFVHAFGTPWLEWWATGRPATEAGKGFKAKEAAYLTRWAAIVHEQVWAYCDKHGIKRPNRCTTTQPAGTKSLLTGASPGWHPPKAQRFIRRITFRKNDPVALACIEYGYSVIPSQSDKDDNGNLLNDPFDPRCTEWLIEIPVAVSWADIPGADQVEISKFDAMSQMDFYMQVQSCYTAHNTSATIELREAEIEPLGQRIFEAIRDDEGYISAALLARFDDLQTFPRLPFEPIDKATYDQLMQGVKERQAMTDFAAALAKYDSSSIEEAGPAGCDSDKCLLPDKQ
jgi:ribonucleotide reductase, class II